MQQLLEEIIFELLNCDKLKYKYIGMQLAHEFTKRSINHDKRDLKIDSIKERLYKILLENVDNNTAAKIQNNNVLIKALSSRISKSSTWHMDSKGNFVSKDNKYTYTVFKNEEGYYAHPRKNYELGKVEADFVTKFQPELRIIHSALTENENLLNNIVCFSNGLVSDKLLSLIVEFMNHKEEIKEVRKIYKK